MRDVQQVRPDDPEYERRLGLALRAAAYRCESVGARASAELFRRASEAIWPDSQDVDYEVLEAMSAYRDITVRSF